MEPEEGTTRDTVRATVQLRRSPVQAQGRAEAAQGVAGSAQVLQQCSLPSPPQRALAQSEGSLEALAGQGEDVELGEAEADLVVELPCGM